MIIKRWIKKNFKRLIIWYKNSKIWYSNYKNNLAIRPLLRKNARLKNTAKTDICYVIGNGPSLKKHDLSKIEGCKIVMNSFYLHPDIKKVNPDFYIFADPESNNLEKQNVHNWWREIDKYTQGLSTKFVLPIGLFNKLTQNGLLVDREKYFIFFEGIFTRKRVKNFDPTKPIPFFYNTLAEGMLLAMYMGYKRIVILGADHDWLSHWKEDRHFYSDVAQPAIGPSITMPYHWWLNAINSMFVQYGVINEIALANGVSITNCSEGGVLDVIPVKSLEQYLKEIKCC